MQVTTLRKCRKRQKHFRDSLAVFLTWFITDIFIGKEEPFTQTGN